MMKIAPIRTDLHGPGAPEDTEKDHETVLVGLLDTLSRTVKIAASRLTQDQPSSASVGRENSSVTALNSRNRQQTFNSQAGPPGPFNPESR